MSAASCHVQARAAQPRSEIEPPDHLAEAEDAVEAVEVQPLDLVRSRHRAVMGVVEQQDVAAGREAMPAQRRDEPRLVPLVHDDDIGAVDNPIRVEVDAVVHLRPELRESRAEPPHGSFAMIAQQICPAPAVARLAGDGDMSAPLQFPHHAAQKMRVAVVPVGNQGVRKDDEAQRSPPSVRHAPRHRPAFVAGQAPSARGGFWRSLPRFVAGGAGERTFPAGWHIRSR